MLQFHIQPDSEIPVSQQLFDQIQFAIASRQYPPGHRLPSTRQLAMLTGLHRNTISKVYKQLEERGLVESIAGSGIYVQVHGHEGGGDVNSLLMEQYPEAKKTVNNSIDELLSQGYNLTQVKEILLSEIDWRLRCIAMVLVTVPDRDIEAGKLMEQEIEQSLEIPVELVPLSQLNQFIAQKNSGTVVTSRYFISEVVEIIEPQSVRVIPVDIYDYAQEIEIIKKLPTDSCLGLVSLSAGTLGVAEIIVHSLRGSDLLIMTAPISDRQKLNRLIRASGTIISDSTSYPLVKQAIFNAREDLIRIPKLICSQNYIGEKSINMLKRELGLGVEE